MFFLFVGVVVSYISLQHGLVDEELQRHSERLEEQVEERTEELQDAKAFAESIISNALEGIAVIGMNGVFVHWNEAFRGMTGYSNEELGFLSIQQVAPGWAAVDEKTFEQTSQSEPVRDFERLLTRKDGSTFPARINISLLTDEAGTPMGMVGFVRDETERKKMEGKLLDSERMVAAGRVAAMVGHDLRGPLQSIMNALYLMKRTPEKAGELQGNIEDSVNYATRILEDLRYSTGDIPVHLQETNVDALLQKTAASSTVPPSIRIDLNVGEGLTSVRLDPLMAQRVLDNLVRNSVEAMAGGGVLSLSAHKEPDGVVIKVSDTGRGIPEEDLNRIFTLFFTSKLGGMGLGLAYCKRAVEAHGGTIEVESEVDRGTTFTVRIPMNNA
ncbi:MAG: ATP-binding protein [Candidatus Bathyarchaeota archaeon]|nr:ATP-binding protein [Candidatus Bathyarchaeota archaeon]